MINRRIAGLLVVLFAIGGIRAVAGADAPNKETSVTIYFRSDIASILNAIAKRANVGIVMPEIAKAIATVRFNHVPVGSAIRMVAAQGGYVVSELNGTYLVGSAEAIKRTLEQSGVGATVAILRTSPATAATAVEQSFPLLTVHVVGSSLTLRGSNEDIAAARSFIKRTDVAAPATHVEARVIHLSRAKASNVAAALKGTFPKLTVTVVGDYTLIISENEPDAAAAIDSIPSIDRGE